MDPLRTRPSLLARLREPGDHDAWREFDERYRDLVARYCRTRGLQPSDADDVRQMVMLRLVESMKAFEYNPLKGKFHRYLGTIVANAISRFKQKKSAEPAALDSNTPQRADEFDESAWEREWENAHIRRALATLQHSFAPKSLQVFYRLLAGASSETVANEFNISVEAVHKIRQRVRAEFEITISQQIRDEDLNP
ncbi:MAG: RNA polymerase sigma factor [Planctomycetota bacterium]